MKTRKMAGALASAMFLTLLAGLGVLYRPDLAVCDLLYQQRSTSGEEIVLVGIDQEALEMIGPYDHWGREVMASALEALNQSEECRPAVIGIDVLYTGETDPEADRLLAQAAGQYGNVITACAAEIGDGLVEREDAEYGLDPFVVTAFEYPYEALRAVTGQGHINTMMDADGILRHHLLTLRLPDGQEFPSLALAVAERYREYGGLEPVRRPPVGSRGFWYLPFCGIPGDFDASVSVADLLTGEAPADHFAGKIVLIGPYAAGLGDSYITASDHARPMYGVEYQANAIQALLWGDYKREAGNGVQLAVLFVLLLFSAVCFRRWKVRDSALLWLSLCGGWLLLCKGLYRSGWILHVLWVPAGVSILYAGSLALNYIHAAWERQRVTRTFKKYVAPEIVNEILEKGVDALKLGGESRDVAVLFVDIRGFTTLSEKLEAAEVVEILNQCLPLFAKCIMDHQGTLDKFIGDAAMAFWGAPVFREDYVMDAVKAAMDMVEGAGELSDRLKERFPGLAGEDERVVSFGIGIHMGKAVVGNVGSSERMDYTVIGDTVNTASRIESETGKRLREKREENVRGGVIYISRAVADTLDGRIRAVSLGPIELKGKEESVEILRLEEIMAE